MLKQLFIATTYISLLTGFSAQSQPADIVEKTHQSIEFLSGGIGGEEQIEMKFKAKDFNTRMSFAEYETGGFITGVEVTLTDSKGTTLLKKLSDGPYLYMQLPKGKYTLKAEYMGQVKTKTLHNNADDYDSGMMRFTWKDMSATSTTE